MIHVRPATLEDLEWLYGQLQDFAKVFPSRFSLFGARKHALELLQDLTSNHVMLVSEVMATEEGGPVRTGLIGGYYKAHPYNPEIAVLCETFWWVDEEFRRTRSGALLLKRFIEIGKNLAHMVTIALEEGSPVRDESLLKRGFKPIERAFMLEVDNPPAIAEEKAHALTLVCGRDN